MGVLPSLGTIVCIVIWAGKKGVDVVMEAQEVAAAERRLSSRRIYEGHILNLKTAFPRAYYQNIFIKHYFLSSLYLRIYDNKIYLTSTRIETAQPIIVTVVKTFTTLVSDQPLFSKWWCIGAILNKRFPCVALKYPTCSTTDITSAA